MFFRRNDTSCGGVRDIRLSCLFFGCIRLTNLLICLLFIMCFDDACSCNLYPGDIEVSNAQKVFEVLESVVKTTKWM